MYKRTGFHRLFISQAFVRSRAIHMPHLWFYIVRRATATAVKQRQRQHHMSVSIPSCAGTRASFCTVCCCSMTTTHDCASNKPSCAKEVIPVTSGNISWFLNLGLYGSSLVQDLSCTSWTVTNQSNFLILYQSLNHAYGKPPGQTWLIHSFPCRANRFGAGRVKQTHHQLHLFTHRNVLI